MLDLSSFENVPLRGGFIIVRLDVLAEPLRDSLGREGIARTRIIGGKF